MYLRNTLAHTNHLIRAIVDTMTTLIDMRIGIFVGICCRLNLLELVITNHITFPDCLDVPALNRNVIRL
jgi:hypothetical protein